MEQLNDWLALITLNPDKDLANFKDLGIDASNTSLKSKEEYENMTHVQKLFSKDNKFDLKLFDNFYNAALVSFNEYLNRDLDDSFYADIEYSILDFSRPEGAKVAKPEVYILKVNNPAKLTMGVEGLFSIGGLNLSSREIAQTQNVVDYSTGKELDFTPNDDDKRGIFDFWTQPMLVKAAWEEDGVHIQNGREVKHLKGQEKLNSNLLPYYETLGNRDVAGKLQLHLSDTWTIDGSAYNKWDFMDSDGIDKSATGSVSNLIASVAPFFIKKVKTAALIATIGVDLTKALSTYFKSGADLTSDIIGDNKKPKGWEWANNIGAYLGSLESSTTDYGADHLTSLESVLTIALQAAKQLVQLRAISLIPGLIRGKNILPKSIMNKYGDEYVEKYGKTLKKAIADGDVDEKFLERVLGSEEGMGAFVKSTEKFNKLSRSLGSYYMGIIQSADVYDVMKQSNFNSIETAAGMVGATIGFKLLMDSALGDVALQGLGLEGAKVISKRFAKEQAAKLGEIISSSNLNTSSGKMAALLSVSNLVLKSGNKLLTNVFTRNMLKEGAEEVSEEMLQDALLTSISAMDLLLSDNKKLKYDIRNSNIAARYSAAALGGVIGGGIFLGINSAELKILANKNKRHGQVALELPDKVFTDILTVVRNGGKNSIIKSIQKRMDAGKIASTQLSMEVVDNLNNTGEVIYKPADTRANSLNDILGNYLINFVSAIDNVMNQDGLSLDDSNVVNAAMNKDSRLEDLSQSSSIAHDILNDFTGMLSSIVKNKLALNSLDEKDTDGRNKLLSLIDNLKSLMDGFLTGDKTLDYTERMLFSLNRSVSSGFTDSDIYMYALSKGKVFSKLSDEEKKLMFKEFKLLLSNIPEYRRTIYNSYRKLKELLNVPLTKFETAEGRDLISLAIKIRESINKQLTDVGNLSEDEKTSIKSNFVKSLVDEAKKGGFLADIEAKFNPTKKANFDLMKAISDEVEHSPELVLEFELAKFNKIYKSFMQKDEAVLAGADPDIIAVASQEQAIRDLNILQMLDLIAALSTASDNKINLDSESIQQLKNLLKLYDTNLYGKNLSRVTAKEVLSKLNAKSINLLAHPKNFLVNSLYLKVLGAHLDLNDKGKFILKIGFDASSVLDLEGLEVTFKFLGKEITADLANLSPGSYAAIELDENSANLITRVALGENNKTSWSEIDKKSLTYQVLSSLDSDTRNTVIAKIQDLLKNSSSISPIIEALNIISNTLVGDSITNLIAEEEHKLLGLSNLTDYVITNSITEEQLGAVLQSALMLRSILMSLSTDDKQLFDFGLIVNLARIKAKLLPIHLFKLEELLFILDDLNKLYRKAHYLILLSKLNTGDKISTSKKTGIRLNTILLLSFLDSSYPFMLLNLTSPSTEPEKFFNNLELFTEAETKDLIRILETGSAELSDYLLSFALLLRFNNFIHTRFLNLTLELKLEIIDLLAGENLFDRVDDESRISKSMDSSDLSGEFVANYLYQHMIADTTEFYNSLKTILSMGTSKFAPFAAQLLDIESNWIFYNHTEEINTWLKTIQDRSSKDIVQGDKLNLNTIYSLGDPGSGKSSAVAYLTHLLIKYLNKDSLVDIWFAAPTNKTATDLVGNVFSKEEATKLTANTFSKSELFAKLLTPSGSAKLDELLKDEHNGVHGKAVILGKDLPVLRPDYFQPEDFTKDAPSVLFIDEITHFSALEISILLTIDTLIGKPIKIFAFGDTSQLGINNKNNIYIGASGGIAFLNPYLLMSVRSNNTTLEDNLTKLSTLLKAFYAEKKRLNSDNISFDVKSYINIINTDLTFKYYEENGVLHGLKKVNEYSIAEILELIKTLEGEEKIAIVLDSLSNNVAKKYENLDPNKVVLLEKDNIQGREFKYVIIDINWDPLRDTDDALNAFPKLLEAYTLMTRAKVATIIVDPNNNSIFKNNLRTNVSKETELNTKDMTDYASVLLASLPGSITEPEPEKFIPEESTPIDKSNGFNIPGIDKSSVDPIKPTLEFLESHSVAYSEFITKGGIGEDSNGLADNDLTTRIILLLRSIIIKGAKGIDLFFSLTASRNKQEIANNIFNLFIPNATNALKLEFVKMLKLGKLFIKVKSAEDGDVNGTIVAGDRLAKVVFRFYTGSEFRDITLGMLGTKSGLLSIEDSLKKPSGTEYFEVSGNILKNNIKLNIGRDIDHLLAQSKEFKSRIWQEHNSLEEYKKKHPELVFSRPIVLGTKLDRATLKWNTEKLPNLTVKSGSLLVLVSSDLTLTEDELTDLLLSHLQDPDSIPLDGISAVYLSPMGFTPNEFFTMWKNIFVLNVNDTITLGLSGYLGGYMLGSRLFSLFSDYKLFLLNPTEYLKIADKYPNRTSIETFKFITEELTKLNITPLDIITVFLNTMTPEGIYAATRHKLEFEIDYSKLSISLLKLTKELVDLLDAAMDKKEDNITNLIEALATLKNDTEGDKFTELHSIFTLIVSDTSYNPALLGLYDLFKSDVLPPIIHNGNIVSRFANMYFSNEEPKFKLIMDLLIPNSRQFGYGILINPIDSVHKILTDGLYFNSGLTSKQVYMTAEVTSPLIYLTNEDVSTTSRDITKINLVTLTESNFEPVIPSTNIETTSTPKNVTPISLGSDIENTPENIDVENPAEVVKPSNVNIVENTEDLTRITSENSSFINLFTNFVDNLSGNNIYYKSIFREVLAIAKNNGNLTLEALINLVNIEFIKHEDLAAFNDDGTIVGGTPRISINITKNSDTAEYVLNFTINLMKPISTYCCCVQDVIDGLPLDTSNIESLAFTSDMQAYGRTSDNEIYSIILLKLDGEWYGEMVALESEDIESLKDTIDLDTLLKNKLITIECNE